MPRAFTATEKETIRDKLMEAGRTCFLRFGMNRTTLDDLVKPAGIAKASFYLFFANKEALFLELLIAEMPAMMSRLLDGSFGTTSNTRDALALLIKGIAYEIKNNEFARIMMDNPSELQKLSASMDFQNLLERVGSFYAPLVAKVMEAQGRGEIIPGDPQQILYSLGMIKMLALNEHMMPPELYSSMMAFVPEVLASGLTNTGQTTNQAAAIHAGATKNAKESS
jgi:AcrR family transcriptional regulator